MKTKTKIQAAIVLLSLIGVSTMVAAGFKEADKNGDGALSLEELKAANMDDMVANFKTLDSNKDGNVSKEEAKANR